MVFPNLDSHQLSGLIGKANKIFFASTQVIASKYWNHKVYSFDDIRSVGQSLNRIKVHPENKLILMEKSKLENSFGAIVDAFEKSKVYNPTIYMPVHNLLESAK